MFIGDDWAEAHHDIEVQDTDGRVLVRRGCQRAYLG